jgi:hypothetical protein
MEDIVRARRAYRRQIVQALGRDGHCDCFCELLVDGRWLVMRGIHEVAVVNDYQAAITLAEALARGDEFKESK